MKLKGRKIHTKIIDMEETNNKEEYINVNKKSNINTASLIILVIILSLISGYIGAYIVLKSTSSSTTSNGITTSTTKLNEPNSISTAVSKIYDAVVVVEAYQKDKQVSTGTGFVYKKNNDKAYIMTNNHVVSGSDKVKVLFTNGEELDTTLIGTDTYSDIAVLTVKDSNKIVSSTIGESSKSKIGDTVFTVGSPEGSDYAGTVTKGILSGKDRLVAVALSNTTISDYYMKVLQTDAAINPGNSGGPICNTNGEVIGITNMKLVDNSVEGMGFAIPIEDAIEFAKTIEETGKVARPYIGISMLDLTNSYYLWQAGILLPEGIKDGVAVYKVEANSPAESAGLKKGDIITKVNGEKITGLAKFRYELYKHKPNEKIKVTYIRNNKEETVEVTLQENK